MIVWRTKKGGDRRIRMGHPWVFASELANSPKEAAPGELIELRDSQDHFLAFGYGHPSSQICFRKLSSRSKDTDVGGVEFFVRRLSAARAHRQASGWTAFSHRWFYAEADGVPGLIIDAFLTANQGWLVVVQASTAGADRLLPQVFEALKTFQSEFGLMTVVEAPSSRARVMEGLKVGDKRVVFGAAQGLEDVALCFADGLRLSCDVLNGQKTGFFLDQQWNARLLKQMIGARYAKTHEPLRVLDVCCYVGQWAGHAVQAVRGLGVEASAVLLDASEAALTFANRNVSALGADVEAVKADALEHLGSLEPASFDVVICDPPAFVKKKADLEAGVRAYAKINREAMKLLKPGGLYVASSCSGLVKAEDSQRILAEASLKSGRGFTQLAAGGHGPDHPLRPEFPEGEYLKCTIGRSGPL